MFIGSLVLFLSSLFVIGFTSLPVFNLITGKKMTVGDDQAFAYNRIEIFVAVILGLFTAVTQYLKYKQTSRNYLLKKIAAPTLAALVISRAYQTCSGAFIMINMAWAISLRYTYLSPCLPPYTRSSP